MAKKEVKKSNKISKKAKITLIIVYTSLIITIIVAAIISAESDNTNNESNENIYLDAPLQACPNKTLREAMNQINSSSNLSIELGDKDYNGSSYKYLDLNAPNERIFMIIDLSDGEVSIIDATADSLENTEYANMALTYGERLLCSNG